MSRSDTNDDTSEGDVLFLGTENTALTLSTGSYLATIKNLTLRFNNDSPKGAQYHNITQGWSPVLKIAYYTRGTTISLGKGKRF